MDSTSYLETGDKRGWLLQFKPCTAQLTPKESLQKSKQEERKMDESFETCQSCGSGCVQDVINSIVVCLGCGLVKEDKLLLCDTKHTNIERMKSMTKQTKHLYVRLVHYKDLVLRLSGNETCSVDPEDGKNMQALLDGQKNVITPTLVEECMRKLKLNKKYLRNKIYLARRFGKYRPAQIDGYDYYRMVKLFKRVERLWKYNHKTIAPGRKVFLNYPFLFFQLSHMVGRPDWTVDVCAPKGVATLRKLMVYWKRVCVLGGQGFFVTEMK